MITMHIVTPRLETVGPGQFVEGYAPFLANSKPEWEAAAGGHCRMGTFLCPSAADSVSDMEAAEEGRVRPIHLQVLEVNNR